MKIPRLSAANETKATEEIWINLKSTFFYNPNNRIIRFWLLTNFSRNTPDPKSEVWIVKLNEDFNDFSGLRLHNSEIFPLIPVAHF